MTWDPANACMHDAMQGGGGVKGQARPTYPSINCQTTRVRHSGHA